MPEDMMYSTIPADAEADEYLKPTPPRYISLQERSKVYDYNVIQPSSRSNETSNIDDQGYQRLAAGRESASYTSL